jgi:hypothetical protein
MTCKYHPKYIYSKQTRNEKTLIKAQMYKKMVMELVDCAIAHVMNKS